LKAGGRIAGVLAGRGACAVSACAWSLRLWLAGAVLIAGAAATGVAADPAAREYDIKAAFLLSFSRFVDWPESALGSTNSPFVIGILGSDPFGHFIDDLVRDEQAHGKPIVIQRYTKVEEAYGAHILFLSRSEDARLESILEKLRGRAILTVGEAGARPFAQRGGMIGLVTENRKIRLRINLETAKAGHLSISSKLLRIGEIVSTGSP
jgi:hypothetical protein